MPFIDRYFPGFTPTVENLDLDPEANAILAISTAITYTIHTSTEERDPYYPEVNTAPPKEPITY